MHLSHRNLIPLSIHLGKAPIHGLCSGKYAAVDHDNEQHDSVFASKETQTEILHEHLSRVA